MCVGASVPDGTIIHDVSTAVRTEPDVGRAVEPGWVVRADERLVAGIVTRKSLDFEGQRFVRLLVEVDQLDLVPDFGSGRGGIRRREPEIAFEAVQDGTVWNRVTDERLGREVDPGERRVRALEGQGRRDLLGRELQHIGDRNVFFQNGRDACRKRRVRRALTQIISGPADWVEYRLARRQEAKPIGKSVIVRGAVVILFGQMQYVRGAV